MRCFGLGAFEPILRGRYLPGKTKAQLVAEVQRQLGSTRLAEWKGLKISLDLIKQLNDEKPGTRRRGVLMEPCISRAEMTARLENNWKKLKDLQTPIDKENLEPLKFKDISKPKLTIEDKIAIYENEIEDAEPSSEPEVEEAEVMVAIYKEMERGRRLREAKLSRSPAASLPQEYGRSSVQVSNRPERSSFWKRVKGSMDSGATFTVGSVKHHAVGHKIDRDITLRTVIDANGKAVPVIGCIYIDV